MLQDPQRAWFCPVGYCVTPLSTAALRGRLSTRYSPCWRWINAAFLGRNSDRNQEDLSACCITSALSNEPLIAARCAGSAGLLSRWSRDVLSWLLCREHRENFPSLPQQGPAAGLSRGSELQPRVLRAEDSAARGCKAAASPVSLEGHTLSWGQRPSCARLLCADTAAFQHGTSHPKPARTSQTHRGMKQQKWPIPVPTLVASHRALPGPDARAVLLPPATKPQTASCGQQLRCSR